MDKGVMDLDTICRQSDEVQGFNRGAGSKKMIILFIFKIKGTFSFHSGAFCFNLLRQAFRSLDPPSARRPCECVKQYILNTVHMFE